LHNLYRKTNSTTLFFDLLLYMIFRNKKNRTISLSNLITFHKTKIKIECFFLFKSDIFWIGKTVEFCKNNSKKIDQFLTFKSWIGRNNYSWTKPKPKPKFKLTKIEFFVAQKLFYNKLNHIPKSNLKQESGCACMGFSPKFLCLDYLSSKNFSAF
jgi:hypothetical protein